MSQYPNAAEGVKKIYISQLIAIAAAVLVVIPWIGFIGTVLAIVGLVFYILGLKKAGADGDGYNKAFTYVVISLVLTFVKAIVSFIPIVGPILSKVLNIVSSVLDLLALNAVITTTCGLLGNVGAAELAENGQSVWTMCMVCTVISIVCNLLGLIPLINILAGIVGFIAAIFSIVAMIRYIIFLNKAATALGA